MRATGTLAQLKCTPCLVGCYRNITLTDQSGYVGGNSRVENIRGSQGHEARAQKNSNDSLSRPFLGRVTFPNGFDRNLSPIFSQSKTVQENIAGTQGSSNVLFFLFNPNIGKTTNQ